MKALQISKFKYAVKSVLNAALGIISESVLVALFIVVAFAVCCAWWSVFK